MPYSEKILTFRELRDGLSDIFEPTQDISQAGCRPEILLLEAELLPD
jgi:hypothetical protein